ncbi:MAG TPA: response regulator transcription factor [Chitinophagaceae bacterium]|nr:response regulator transcription factor [Chitinophagaceae bacterium]MCC6635669.1 response regulator transcription factor [Chitinophagaceae bacterium]HMZ45451.1 response regulator transcription factor [Chitinophagaceae bacterium]HNF29735.1 response regulator transcription factor [Chitinophagaceae bacterium]HNJ58618.1 response regulator transcription factor [Chitinophagaceae bacterium]
MDTPKINIAIVDDHQIVIDGIVALLTGYHSINIVATSTSGLVMLEILQSKKVQILLTDIMMPAISGQDLAKQVKANFPEIKILALSMSGQGHIVSKMIEDADIAGYVLKNIGKDELFHAIENIANGGVYFSQEVLNELQHFTSLKKENETINLTVREIEIIKLIEKEFSNKEIANELFISERTVETHRKNIFRKTGTSGIVGLLKYAYEHKLI